MTPSTPTGDGIPRALTALSGELGAMNLFDIAQMLVLCGHTGILTVRHDDHRGHFYYQDGAIVSVTDDRGNEGMIAAVGVLLWERGRFEFDARDVQVARTIEERGDAFLLEAARQVDEFRESQTADGVESESGRDLSAEASLMLRQRAMERLRDLFSHVTSESDDAPADSGIFELDVLTVEPARLGVDTIYLRPGHKVVGRRDRHMVPLWQERLDDAALRRWLGEVTPAFAAAGLQPGCGGAQFSLTAQDGCLLDVSVSHDSAQVVCVVRIVIAEVEEPWAVGLDPELLEPLLARPRGLVVLAAPRGRMRARAFASLVTLAARQRSGLLVTAERQRRCLLGGVGFGGAALEESGVTVFQHRTAEPAALESALDFCRAEEADVLGADPLVEPVAEELAEAAWPLLVIGVVGGRGAIEGLRAVGEVIGATTPEQTADWLRRNLVAVVAPGRLTSPQGQRTVAEVLVASETVFDCVAAGRFDDLERAFAAGGLPGSISLAGLAARIEGRAS